MINVVKMRALESVFLRYGALEGKEALQKRFVIYKHCYSLLINYICSGTPKSQRVRPERSRGERARSRRRVNSHAAPFTQTNSREETDSPREGTIDATSKYYSP